MQNTIRENFGNIDIYLFDQLLKGRYDAIEKLLDVGCGHGRNLHWFLRKGCQVFGIDSDASAVQAVKVLSAALSPANPLDNFMVCPAEQLPFADEGFELVICSAVLHFAKDEQHFQNMLRSMFRVLQPGGYFFARLASSTGLEERVKSIGHGRYLLPDGTERFLVNEQQLLQYTSEYGVLYEPIKTTNVQQLRCMTTWCVQKM